MPSSHHRQSEHDTAHTAVLVKPRRARRVVAKPSSHEVGRDWNALRPRGAYARRGREVFNAVLVLAILPVVAALALPVAAANWCAFRDPRRILFVQPRIGYRGRVFHIYKFRTMRESSGGSHASWSGGHDAARVTTFGRFLRNTHLDELPQILNILKRDMDVIGPRPEMVEIERWAEEHIDGFSKRLAIRPGITGIAQITQGYTGHDLEAYRRKYEINMGYLRSMSLRLDLEIVARTAIWMLRGKGWSWNAPKVRVDADDSRSADA